MPAIPVPAVGDRVEVRLVSTFGGQVCSNVLHYRVETVVGAAPDYQRVCQQIDASLATAMKNMMSDEASYLATIIAKVFPLPRSVSFVEVGAQGDGLQVGEALPGQVTGILTKQSVLAGPAGRGRMYVPFPTEGDNGIDGRPTIGYGARLTALCDLLDDKIIAVPAPPAVGSCTLTPIIMRRSDYSYNDIFACRPNRLWATQKRRSTSGPGDFPPG